MNILSISGILPIPGIIENNDFILELYSSLKKNYIDTEIVIINPIKYRPELYQKLRKDQNSSHSKNGLTRIIRGFRVEIFPFFSSWSIKNLHAIITGTIYFMNWNRIRSLINTYHFNIIHAQYLFPDAMLAHLIWRKYKIPYIVTSHNEFFYFNHLISRHIALKIMKHSRRNIAINYTNYLRYVSFQIKNLDYLPLGFDESFVKKQKTELPKVTRILTIAKLVKTKNVDLVIRALKKLVHSCDISYTIIGHGSEKTHLVHLVRKLRLGNYVHFIDYISHDKIADEMYKYDIFIMPSYFETFGRVYFEAMAMGIPIICAKNSGIYGFFKDGEEGIAVNHTDINQIHNALKFLITNPEKRLKIGLQGKKLVNDYTWNSLSVIYSKIYREAIENNQTA